MDGKHLDDVPLLEESHAKKWTSCSGCILCISNFCNISAAVRSVFVPFTQHPSKAIHALKMAFAMVLAFLLVLVRAPYDQLGGHAIWAIMTVIVVFEFSVGATLSRGLNRGVATLFAGLLAIAVSELAGMSGGLGHPILIGVSVYIIGGVVSFAKLLPSMKPCEFGLRTFLITFSLIMAAEYRGGNPLETAIDRFWVILLGAVIGVTINVCLLPSWAGTDLHVSILANFNRIAESLEACVDEYLQATMTFNQRSEVPSNQGQASCTINDPCYKHYMSVLVSSSKEESLAGFAKWEFPHGRFKSMYYPWHMYVKLGEVLRNCAYSMVALHGCLESATQASIEVRKMFESEFRAVGKECAAVLRKLAKQVEDMKRYSRDSAKILQGVEGAVNRLQESLYVRSYLLVREEPHYEYPAYDSNANLVGTHTASGNLGFHHHILLQHEEISNCNGHRSNTWSSPTSCSASTAGSDVSDQVPLAKQKVRILESTCALSLGTFATLLMDVAHRLQYVVAAVEELSKLAHYEELREEDSHIIDIP